MPDRVAIVGIGHTQFRGTSPGVSYKEIMFEAATKAYADADLDPRRDIDSFVCCSEDFTEGTSIFDEYVPDQIGAALRPVHTISGDGLQGLAAAHMQILTGAFDVVAVEAHSKASNILTPHHVMALALDPVFVRSLGAHPHFVAGLEMSRYLAESGTSREQCGQVVAKNRGNALFNDAAAYAADLEAEDVLEGEPAFWPLGHLDISAPADGAVVVVLASEASARALGVEPVWILGVGWCSDSFALDSREWGTAAYARLAAEQAAEQVLADGGHFERSPMYHVEVMDDLLTLGVLVENENVRRQMKETWRRMATFLLWARHPDGQIPLFGDGGLNGTCSPDAMLWLAKPITWP